MKKDSTQIVYACSMHPEVTGKEGDKCSKCGMKLEAMKTSDSTATHHH
jgi:transcription initiation factor IIE alpha subunit